MEIWTCDKLVSEEPIHITLVTERRDGKGLRHSMIHFEIRAQYFQNIFPRSSGLRLFVWTYFEEQIAKLHIVLIIIAVERKSF
jgi:hypothetical protein